MGSLVTFGPDGPIVKEYNVREEAYDLHIGHLYVWREQKGDELTLNFTLTTWKGKFKSGHKFTIPNMDFDKDPPMFEEHFYAKDGEVFALRYPVPEEDVAFHPGIKGRNSAGKEDRYWGQENPTWWELFLGWIAEKLWG